MIRTIKNSTALVLAALCSVACGSGSTINNSTTGGPDPDPDPTPTPGPGPQNEAPVVDAGPNFSVSLGATAQLNGSATDDGIPEPMSHMWTSVSGPGNAVFLDPDSLNARVEFDAAGPYTLRLTTSDGELSTTDEVIVTVSEPAPVILPYGGAEIDNVTGITPVITISRTTGQIPCVVQATAVDSSATWVNPTTLMTEPLPNPYDQLHYTWDFGDGEATETLAHPVTGVVVDADLHQTGPQATFIYRRPGTYTVTLTASIKDLSGTVTEANTTVLITVSDFVGQTRYFDPAGGNDANDGLSSATPWRSWNAFSGWVTGGDNRRALLKRGTTLIQTDRLINERSHTRVEPYGTGADPIIQAGPSYPTSPMVSVQATHFLEDHVYRGLNLRGMGRANTIVYAFGSDDPAAHDVVFMDCTFENTLLNGEPVPYAMNLVALTGDHLSRFAFWECHFLHNDAPGHGLYARLYGGTEPAEFLSVVGGSFLGGDGRPILDHHIYASGWRRYDLMRWIDFGQVINKNFCINMDCAANGNNTEYMLIDGCDITGTSNGLDASNGQNNPALGQFDHFILQNTAVHDGDPATGYGMFGYCIRRLIVRDSCFYGNPRSDFRVEDADANYQVYRNIFWRDCPGSTTTGLRLLSGQRGVFKDNIFEVASNPGFDQRVLGLHLSEASNWTFSGNQYWTPYLVSLGQISPFMDRDTGQRLTMAQWEALFPNEGPYANPQFPNPAQGQF